MHYQGFNFSRCQNITQEIFKDTFLHWVETDNLPVDRMAAEMAQDPVLSSIISIIRNLKKNGVIVPGQKDNSKK